MFNNRGANCQMQNNWWKKLLGIVAGGVLLLHLHVAGGVVLLSSLGSAGALLSRHRRKASKPDEFNFGWVGGWTNGFALASTAALIIAVALQIKQPQFWPVAALLLLWVPIFATASIILRSFLRHELDALPMVDLLRSDHDSVLDAGCGSGRTSISLAPLLKYGTITAVDRFNARYIEQGGRALLDRNLALAKMTDRVRIETADLTALPFATDSFDSAVSTNVFDHLGPYKQTALAEVLRVLKPGSRFLLTLWVPSWMVFLVMNVFTFFLTTKAGWQDLAKQAGFRVITHGFFNYSWFVLLEKPNE